MSLEEISEKKTNVYSASLVRCAQKLGFSGFSLFLTIANLIMRHHKAIDYAQEGLNEKKTEGPKESF